MGYESLYVQNPVFSDSVQNTIAPIAHRSIANPQTSPAKSGFVPLHGRNNLAIIQAFQQAGFDPLLHWMGQDFPVLQRLAG
jgi:hypothetical protein